MNDNTNGTTIEDDGTTTYSTIPIDNYWTRRHNYHQNENDNHDANSNPNSILIVGGTDGSGTRAFVDTLKELGCIIVYDDSITFDIHASELFKKQGWPAFVNTILHHTHTANYEVTTDYLPFDVQQTLQREMMKFQHSLETNLCPHAPNRRQRPD